MPSGPRPTARPGAGPGRGKTRARPSARERGADVAADGSTEPTVDLGASPAGRAARSTPAKGTSKATTKGTKSAGSGAGTKKVVAAAAAAASSGPSVLQRAVRANLTARALALVVVVLVLTISYATSLRIYFAQAHEIAATKSEIAQSQASIADLQTQLGRWNDPTFVAAQARERLGWLVPGETGYTVVGPDGKPLGGGLTLDSSATVDPEPQQMWWDRMWGSVKAADKPAPPKQNPGTKPPITNQTKPR